MRIHYLQHVDFEDPAEILNWASQKKHDVTCTRLYNNEGLPDIKDFDALVVMGGPMSTNEEELYPWLKDEKKFINESIRHEKIVLGICLGAQLIAEAEGSRIFKNKHKEIGWFPVEIQKHPLLFPDEISALTAFHWHGDTFEIPQGYQHIAESEACKNQGFISNDGRVTALQFHLESSKQSINNLIKNAASDLTPGDYVQNAEEIINKSEIYLTGISKTLNTMMNRIEEIYNGSN